jgi:cytochrome c oxidase subunit 2
MKRALILTAAASFSLGYVTGWFSAVGVWFFQARSLMNEVVANHDAFQVHCFAKKYAWHFHYAGADGKLGDTDNSLVTADNPVGLNHYDPRSKDDLVSNELVLPCNTQVELITGSADVIHALGEFHEKMEIDATPGVMERGFFQTPVKPANGTLRCVQLCGPGFQDHHAVFRYLSAEEFDQWLSQQPPFLSRVK